MADNARYLLGDSALQKLRSTISKVDSLAFGGPVSRIPTIIEGDAGTPSGKVFRVATFTGSWTVNSSKIVTLKYQTATPNTVSVSNLFFPVTSTATATRDCAIAKDGTAWFLINVPYSTATAVFIGATAAGISVSSTATGTIITSMSTGTLVSSVKTVANVTDISLSASLNSANCSISIGKTLITSSSMVIGGTATSLIVGATSTGVIVRATATSTFIVSTFSATFIQIG